MVVFIENKTVNYENSAIFAQWLEIRAECPFLVVRKAYFLLVASHLHVIQC